jgi:hypothetical protein
VCVCVCLCSACVRVHMRLHIRARVSACSCVHACMCLHASAGMWLPHCLVCMSHGGLPGQLEQGQGQLELRLGWEGGRDGG